MISNQQGILITYEVRESLHYKGDRRPVTSSTKTVRRPADRPMASHVQYRAEWVDSPASAYTWSFFDHDDDIIAIHYHVKEISRG